MPYLYQVISSAASLLLLKGRNKSAEISHQLIFGLFGKYHSTSCAVVSQFIFQKTPSCQGMFRNSQKWCLPTFTNYYTAHSSSYSFYYYMDTLAPICSIYFQLTSKCQQT